ncbi:alpha-amylase family glycosyl hydrolase, partial [Actinomadura verrucosospora]
MARIELRLPRSPCPTRTRPDVREQRELSGPNEPQSPAVPSAAPPGAVPPDDVFTEIPSDAIPTQSGPLPDAFDPETPRDPHWFKTAVFYEVSVRGFADSNNDGYGDLRGLISKLDHLQWLGVDCLWLLPIYQSPLKDGGYDIAEYTKILPDFGELGDFVELIEEAHARGIRVIADLVMNHTSDQHPWFQASR